MHPKPWVCPLCCISQGLIKEFQTEWHDWIRTLERQKAVGGMGCRGTPPEVRKTRQAAIWGDKWVCDGKGSREEQKALEKIKGDKQKVLVPNSKVGEKNNVLRRQVSERPWHLQEQRQILTGFYTCPALSWSHSSCFESGPASQTSKLSSEYHLG